MEISREKNPGSSDDALKRIDVRISPIINAARTVLFAQSMHRQVLQGASRATLLKLELAADESITAMCCCCRILFNQPDFRAQESELVEYIKQ